MKRWDYNRETRNTYRLPHHKGYKIKPHPAPFHQGRMQNAIDFGLPVGEKIYSALDGIVIDVVDEFEDNGKAEWEYIEKCNFVTIRHKWNEFSTYVHLKKGSVRVEPGDVVLENQFISEIGLSGYTNYPHLHFSVYKASERYDDPTLLVRFRRQGKIFTMRSDNST